MLYFFKVRVDHSGLSEDEMWDLWEQEADAALGAMDAGIIVSLYKVVGQRRVIGIANVESHDQLDQIVMAGLPMRHILEWEEIVPIREYRDFAADVKARWQ